MKSISSSCDWSDRYQLVELKTSCEEILIASLDAKNCIDILLVSDLHNAPGLKTAAFNFAAENMKSISSSCDWKKELASVPSLLTDMIETFSTISDSLKKSLRDFIPFSKRREIW